MFIEFKIAKNSQYYNSRRPLRPTGVTLVLFGAYKEYEFNFKVTTFSKIEESWLKSVFAPIFDGKKSELWKKLAFILVKNTNRTFQQPYPIFRDKIKYTTINNFNIFY